MLGGGEHRYYWIAKNLVKKGHDVYVYTMKLENTPDTEEVDGILIKRIGNPHPRTHRAFSPLIPYFFKSSLLTNDLKKNKIEIIDTNTYIPCLSGAILSKITRIPQVVTFHDVYWNRWGESLGRKWAQILGPALELLVSKLPCYKYITVSEASKIKISNLLKVPEERIQVIPNGIDLSVFNCFQNS